MDFIIVYTLKKKSYVHINYINNRADSIFYYANFSRVHSPHWGNIVADKMLCPVKWW